MKEQNDLYFIEQVLAGRTDAYAVLVDKYKDSAFALAVRLVKNYTDAEEVLQEAFVKAYQSLKKFRGEAAFSSWLYRIVYTTGISFIRKKKLDFSCDVDHELSNTSSEMYRSGFEEMNLSEQQNYLKKAIDMLKPEDSFLLTLYYYEESNTVEIAKITGLKESNVRVKLMRARMQLKTCLETLLHAEADLRTVS